MNVKHDRLYSSEEDPTWIRVVKIVLFLVLGISVFLLADSMVHHHFFTGGSLNYHNGPTGP